MLKWARHVDRLEGEQLTKRADALRVEGRRRRSLGWEDYVKRVLEGAEGNELDRVIRVGEWRTRVSDKEGEWRRAVETGMKRDQ